MENNFKDNLKVQEEIIDGFRIVHTGKMHDQHNGYNKKFSWEGGGYEDLGYESKEILEMYDTNGNRFYSNCSSLEESQKLVEKLKAKGKDAIIGPKAPWIDIAGKPTKNKHENAVGFYIVKAIEEQQKSENENEIGK